MLLTTYERWRPVSSRRQRSLIHVATLPRPGRFSVARLEGALRMTHVREQLRAFDDPQVKKLLAFPR